MEWRSINGNDSWLNNDVIQWAQIKPCFIKIDLMVNESGGYLFEIGFPASVNNEFPLRG